MWCALVVVVVHECMCAWACVCLCVCACVHVFACVCVRARAGVCTCVHGRVHVCVRVHIVCNYGLACRLCAQSRRPNSISSLRDGQLGNAYAMMRTGQRRMLSTGLARSGCWAQAYLKVDAGNRAAECALAGRHTFISGLGMGIF